MNWKTLPYTKLLKFVDRIKKKVVTVPWPENAPERNVTSAAAEWDVFRSINFEGTVASYHYTGEIYDLRRPLYLGGEELEIHVRIGDDPEGRKRTIGHVEYSRYERPTDHIREKFMYWLSEDELTDLVTEGRLMGETNAKITDKLREMDQ